MFFVLVWRVEDSNVGRIFSCLHCDYSTTRKGCILRHANDKHNPNPIFFIFPYCEYKSKQKYSLKQHIVMIHSADHPVFSCDRCPYKTKYKSRYYVHAALRH
jgi:hypothetical protein